MKIKYLLLATISGAIIAVDQLAKTFIHTHYHLGQARSIIPSLFDLVYVRNYGAAFGVLSTFSQNFREPFFFLVPFVALVVIIFLMRGTRDDDRIQIFGLSLIFGGAIGNYIDRIRFKYVIDFLDVHYRDVYHWPAFNIADSAIVCGVVLLCWQIIFSRSSQTAKSSSSSGSTHSQARSETKI